MAKLLCDAGTLSIGVGAGLQAAVAELRSVSISGAAGTTNGQAMEDAYPEEFVTSKVYTIEAEAYASSTTDVIFVITLGAIGTAKLTSQKNSLPTTIFDGDIIVAAVGDVQTQGGLEMQRVTLRSTGAPDTINI
jgi:hypothetical protein